MSLERKTLSATDAEERLRAGQPLEGCIIPEPLQLRGEYSQPVVIRKCELAGVRAEGCVFTKQVQLQESEITYNMDFTQARFCGEMDWLNVNVKGPATFQEAVFEKKVSLTVALFQDEVVFERARFEADCDMNEVSFDHAEFGRAVFQSNADFSFSEFDELADFSNTCFEQEAKFESATFSQGADFGGAVFKRKAAFQEAVFNQNVYFNEVVYNETADYDMCEFHQHADFRGAQFKGSVEFRSTNVEEGVHFTHAQFEGRTDFNESHFGCFNGVKVECNGPFNFKSVILKGNADFRLATFYAQGDFSHSEFKGKADFLGARFSQVNFESVVFSQEADFYDATFGQDAEFDRVEFKDCCVVCLNARFNGRINIKWAQIKKAIEKKKYRHVKEGDHKKAAEEFGRLKSVFENNNDYDAMDLAYEAFRYHENMASEKPAIFKCLNKIFLYWCSGYGTKPFHILFTSLVVIVGFGLVYWVVGSQLFHPPDDGSVAPSGIGTCIFFSLTTFYVGGVEGVAVDPEHWGTALTALETFLGFTLSAVFIVMLARKLTR